MINKRIMNLKYNRLKNVTKFIQQIIKVFKNLLRNSTLDLTK